MYRKTIAALAVLIAGPAAAQDTGWTFQGSLYAWVPSLSATIGTPFGDLETEANGSGALSALDMAFMGTLEARRGKWSLIGDLLYVDLSSDTDSPFGLRFKGSTVETKTTAFSGYAVYRTYESDRAIVDAGAASAPSTLASISASSPPTAGPTTTANRARPGPSPSSPSGSSCPSTSRGSPPPSSTAAWRRPTRPHGRCSRSVGYRFNERWSTQVGWRYMDVQKDIGGLDTSLDLSGPLIGVSARF